MEETLLKNVARHTQALGRRLRGVPVVRQTKGVACRINPPRWVKHHPCLRALHGSWSRLVEQGYWNVFEVVCSKIAVASVVRHCQGDVLSEGCLKLVRYDR